MVNPEDTKSSLIKTDGVKIERDSAIIVKEDKTEFE